MSRIRSTIQVGVAALAAAGALTLAACGGSGQQQAQGGDMSQMQGMQNMPGMDMSGHQMPGMGPGQIALWAVQTGQLGTVVTDATGHVMHRFDKDSAAPSTTTCTGSCATAWPPVLLPAGQQPELMGVDAGQVGTVKRPDGSIQITLAGWPLYTNAQDDGSLSTTAGQGTDGTWYAIAPDGSKATTP